jgi:RNA polymerase sigma-70 factor (ECF subfamily)
MKILASEEREAVDGGGEVRAVPKPVEGADNVARLMIGATRPHPGSWWRDDFRLRLGAVNGLPGLIVDSRDGPVQTTAFEIEGGVVRAMYVVRNPRKLRHLAAPRA